MSATTSPRTELGRLPTRDIAGYLRHQIRGRRALIAAAVLLGAPALWFGWPWLVMAGLAPLILAVAPCAIMCAAGACAMGRSCDKAPTGAAPPAANAGFGQGPTPPKL